MKSVKKYNMHKKIITLFYCVVGATLSVLAQEKNLADLLSAQIEYPLAAQQNKVSGAVVVDVLITEKGEMKKNYLRKGIGDGCSKSVLQVIENIKDWNPFFSGFHSEQVLRIPIYFTDANLLPNAISDSMIWLNVSNQNKDSSTSKAFEYVESMPEFPGGEGKLIQFLSHELRFPNKAIDNGTTGKVLVQFIVDTNGNIENAKIKKGIGDGCDEESLRVIKKSPKWKSGEQNGKKVKVYFVQPINFALADDKRSYDVSIMKQDTIRIYSQVNQHPLFKGGLVQLKDTLSSMIKMKLAMVQNKKEGTMDIAFEVDPQGKTTGIKVLESMGKEYDNVVTQAIEKLPTFTYLAPTTTNVKYILRVPFEK